MRSFFFFTQTLRHLSFSFRFVVIFCVFLSILSKRRAARYSRRVAAAQLINLLLSELSCNRKNRKINVRLVLRRTIIRCVSSDSFFLLLFSFFSFLYFYSFFLFYPRNLLSLSFKFILRRRRFYSQTLEPARLKNT